MTIASIENALRQPLPGRKAQHLMAPGYRPDYSPEDIARFHPRIGGVLLLLREIDGDIYIIFTLRKTYEGTHSGQMSFPGGKEEPSDADITATALRETQEEVGISSDHIRIIGSLTELYIPPSNFLVYPSVGVVHPDATYIRDEKEVAEIIEIPLSFFLDKNNRVTTTIHVSDKASVEVPAFIYQHYTIWGATAIMMGEFLYILDGAG